LGSLFQIQHAVRTSTDQPGRPRPARTSSAGGAGRPCAKAAVTAKINTRIAAPTRSGRMKSPPILHRGGFAKYGGPAVRRLLLLIVCSYGQEGQVRRCLKLFAETLIGSETHTGSSLRQRVEEVAVVSQARSQSVRSERGPAFRVLALALVDQAAAVPTQKVGAGRVQDPNKPSVGSDN